MKSDDNLDEIGQILRDVKYPERLAASTSPWLSSNLVRSCIEDTKVPAYQALKLVLTEVLDELEQESPDDAAILRGRFWEGHTAKKMIAEGRPKQWQERTFYLYQKRAIQLFVLRLTEREEACRIARAERASSGRDSGIQSGAVQPVVTAPKNWWLMLLSSMVGLVLGMALFAAYTHQRSGAGIFPAGTEGGMTPAAVVPLQETTPTAVMATEAAVEPTLLIEANEFQSVCGESERIEAPGVSRFVRHQGVSTFTRSNTDGAVISDRVRALANDERGLWMGYFARDGGSAGGVGQYDKQSWADCSQAGITAGQDVNAVVIDHNGGVWVGMEKSGVAHFDGKRWVLYTTANGLPSDEVFSLTVDADNNIWAGTWEGAAKFDGTWSTPYTAKNDTLYNDRVHAIAFDAEQNIWVGHVRDGISQYRQSDGRWVQYTTETSGLGGNEVRSILVQAEAEDQTESIWIATEDGGLSRFVDGEWTVYGPAEGLPGQNVKALAIDRYNRVWAATAQGTAFFDDEMWQIYHTLDTLSIAIGAPCPEGCPFDDDVVWTGTAENGLTHSRLPLPDAVIDVKEVCFVTAARERICPPLEVDTTTPAGGITASYPERVRPGETLRFEVTVSLRGAYELREDRGDFLSSTDESDIKLFGAWPIIPVRGTVAAGQPFTFTDFDNPFVAPEPSGGSNTFESTWRVWMRTRYVGPYVRLVFTVGDD
jgi:hypothetical protein